MHYLEHLVEKEEKGTISEAESRLLERFFSDEYQRAEWDGEQMGKKAAVSAQIYTQIKKRAHFGKSWTSYIKYAAVALVALTVGAGILLNSKINPKAITLNTAGNIDSVKLVDGSMVYLAAYSSLQYSERFGGNVRAATLLNGNAFFKVAKDQKHPFIITSGAITTNVLDASFYIDLDKDKASVKVITGQVKVVWGKQVAFLKPNESVVFRPGVGLRKVQTREPLSAFGTFPLKEKGFKRNIYRIPLDRHPEFNRHPPPRRHPELSPGRSVGRVFQGLLFTELNKKEMLRCAQHNREIV